MFEDSVLTDDVVLLCAAFAAQDKGSVRQALHLLLEAGNLARRQNDATVTEDHVRDAKQLLEKQRIEESMKDLTSHGHLTLLAIVASTIADPDALPLQKQTLYDQYQNLAEATDRDPLGGRAFHNHLAKLSMLGILDWTKQNEGRAGGIYYEYQIDVPLDAALSTLENLHMSDELDLGSLRETAQEKNLI